MIIIDKQFKIDEFKSSNLCNATNKSTIEAIGSTHRLSISSKNEKDLNNRNNQKLSDSGKFL